MMKKLLVCLLALVLALSLVACGGDDTGNDANADDPGTSDVAGGEDVTNPLEAMEFVEVPEGIVGTRWEFCGGFLSGVEMDSDQATEMLKSNGGVLEIDVDDVDKATYIRGSEVLTGTCGVTEDNMTMVISLPNEDGTTADSQCMFADLNGTVIMVLVDGPTNNGLYFRMIEEG